MALRQWLQAYLGLTAIQQRRGRKMVTEPVKHREEYNDYCNWCDRKRVCHAVNPDRNLRALSRACEKSLSPLVDSFAKSMRIKDRNDAEQHLRGLLADLTINGK